MVSNIHEKRTTHRNQTKDIQPASQTVYVDRFIDGILDPERPMLGPVRDGGYIIANTTPGCWGPMITPEIRGGHEVTIPVAVDGAEVGDAIAIHIQDITVTSIATASGNDTFMQGRFLGDPYVAGRCPNCETLYPKTRIEGIGQTAVRCAYCGADAAPFNFTNGYTIAFDSNQTLGVTLNKSAAEKIAHEARHYAALPDNSIQNPILIFAPHDLVGLTARMRPFMGQLGTTPAVQMPDSHNAGDFGSFLIGAPHEYALTADQLALRTDGHLDIDAVRAGAILVCPVKVPGGGIYMGDMHAMQGDGEIAGHTCDVSGTVTLQVQVIKGLQIDGPILFPVLEDLPYLAKPLTADEDNRARKLAEVYGIDQIEQSVPISVIGSGPDLNSATDNGLERAANLLEMSIPEVKNRATITGAIEIGRHPGIIQVTLRVPVSRLEQLGLLRLAEQLYGIA
jgi:formamidase